eukprot:483249-Hanusia_phi.AAC.1
MVVGHWDMKGGVRAGGTEGGEKDWKEPCSRREEVGPGKSERRVARLLTEGQKLARPWSPDGRGLGKGGREVSIRRWREAWRSRCWQQEGKEQAGETWRGRARAKMRSPPPMAHLPSPTSSRSTAWTVGKTE